MKTVLARLMPTPYTEPTDTPPVSVNILHEHDPNYMRQAALQIAFALEKGVHGDPSRTVEHVPVKVAPPAPPAPYIPETSAPIETLQEIADAKQPAPLLQAPLIATSVIILVEAPNRAPNLSMA